MSLTCQQKENASSRRLPLTSRVAPAWAIPEEPRRRLQSAPRRPCLAAAAALAGGGGGTLLAKSGGQGRARTALHLGGGARCRRAWVICRGGLRWAARRCGGRRWSTAAVRFRWQRRLDLSRVGCLGRSHQACSRAGCLPRSRHVVSSSAAGRWRGGCWRGCFE